MKKILSIFILLTFFLSFSNFSFAQEASICPTVDEQNYIACCFDSASFALNSQKCNQYTPDAQKCATPTSTASNWAFCCSPQATYDKNKAMCDQVAKSCPVVDYNNYDECCTLAGSGINSIQCSKYDANNTNSSGATTTNTSCTTINSTNYSSCCFKSGGGSTGTTQCLAYETQLKNSPINPGVGGSVAFSVKLKNPLKVDTIQGAVKAFMSAIVRIAIPFIVVFLIYSGFMFISARGNPTKITEAKNMFLYTIIGTLLILGAWAITNAIVGTVNSLGS